MLFRAYEYVITLAEEKSFSKAAKRLFISQPSLSQYISRIENEMNVILFDRGSVPLRLTYEGELYVETAQKIMSMHRQLLNTYDDSKKLEKGRLNIGLTPSKVNHPLPMILPVFYKQYPHIDLSIMESSSSDLEEFLEKGLVDICILNLPVSSANIVSEPLFAEKILLAVPEEKVPPEHVKGYISYEDIKRLENEKFILLHPGQRLRQIANGIFAKAGLKPKILLETGNIETSARLASAGAGLAFVPETFAAYSVHPASTKYLPVGEPPLSWTIGVAFHKDRYITKAARAFIGVTKEVIREIL